MAHHEYDHGAGGALPPAALLPGPAARQAGAQGGDGRKGDHSDREARRRAEAIGEGEAK